ncbi:sensor histidine kinase [Streptomyces sp. SAS_270]|uniref:sensor histidine kinase n=1 Tax=Streptomyces sp. SAS_270 TaxID=3412748 RepID=UPI00403CD300
MIQSLQRYLSCHPRVVDAAVAVALLAGSLPGSMVSLQGGAPGIPWWPGLLMTGVSCTVLLWRRSRPRTAVALNLVCAAAGIALGYLVTALLLGPLMVALYALAVRTGRRTANTFAFTGVALLIGTALLAGPDDEPLVLKLLGPAFWLLLPTSLGTVTRLRAAYLEAVQARAEHAERTREEEARHRVTEERMRIARDLHDVVAHHLVLANIQAGTVARFLRTRPEEAERIVSELTGITSVALRELKATVGLLRDANETTRPAEDTPGLARLPDLAASFEGAGLTVTVTTEGAPRPLSAGADLTVYRVVQEALTNVTKHADTRTAEVRLTYSPDRLGIAVTNGGRGRRSDSAVPNSGYGLVGMHERARSVGGRLRARPRPEGGFEVVLQLPLEHRPAEESAVT